MKALILAIYTHTIRLLQLFSNSTNKMDETVSMARKVRKMSKGANSSRKRNGGRTPIVEYVSSPIRETDDRNNDLQVSDDDDASRNEGSSTHDESGELHRTRGPNRGMDVPEDLEDRPTIFTVGGRFPDSRVTSDIVVTIKGNFEGAWATWRKVTQEMRDLYWDKFKKHFKWPMRGESQIYRAWCKNCSDRFRDILGSARKNAKKVSGSKNAKDWIDLNPEWMNSTIWNKLIKDVWSKKEWQDKSDSGTKNRLSGNDKASPTYTGGSIPMSAHEIRLRKELKRNPTELELFDHTQDGWGIYETYETIIKQKYPDPESRPNFDVTAWKDASGRAKGRRLYGFGNTRQTLEYERDGADVEGSNLDQGALKDIIKLKIGECTNDLIKNLNTILPEMVCEVLEHLRQNDVEDEETRNSYDSYDSYEDDFEINMDNSRRHRIYAKNDGKKHAYGKITNGDQHDMSKKHKKARKQK
ncbi:hypothetical protein OROMI_003502 [Orobanche minor]